ncbi:Regulator of Vps4 activity in the MVB pathway protein [Striga hermonthica]|uniref:Regulator of Vps4 activity in the MVB pathway protein n=1 Tax=Striga hermonthica TaxID=68872 RepID=A0A9N7N3F9_STRHE|nr:Regulator of Vps4 activity in the MVB pathway protein [Striga hermonthica]
MYLLCLPLNPAPSRPASPPIPATSPCSSGSTPPPIDGPLLCQIDVFTSPAVEPSSGQTDVFTYPGDEPLLCRIDASTYHEDEGVMVPGLAINPTLCSGYGVRVLGRAKTTESLNMGLYPRTGALWKAMSPRLEIAFPSTAFRIKMSVLNQLFNRGLLGTKCKTCLTLAISRIKLLQNKRDVQLKLMRKEIAEFLQAGQEAIARIRVEHVIREQNTWEAYEILELFCEFVLARVPILESQRECPTELREAVASIIFSAPRCLDLPDLLHVKNLFASKYGKEFIAAASELRPDTSVNRTIIEKLSVSAPPVHLKLKVLKEIAREYNINWDSSATEAEFRKKPEDLLNGPKQIAAQSHAHSRPKIENNNSSKQLSETSSETNKQDEGNFSGPHTIEPLARKQHVQAVAQVSSQPSDVLERAQAAIAAAERASAAARAAARLVNAQMKI